MMFLETYLEPIRDPDAAVKEWLRIFADCEEQQDAEGRCKALALGMMISEEVRCAVEQRAVGRRAAVRGFVSRLARLAERVRIASLQILVEADPAVASFVARHPQVIPILSREESEDDKESELSPTPLFRMDPKRFVRKMKLIAPLMLERVGIGREHAESFLRHLHHAAIVERLQRAKSVRMEIREILAEFWCQECSGQPDQVRSYLTREVMDNIIWQVGTVVRRMICQDSEDRDRLRQVEIALQTRLTRRQCQEPARHTVAHALLLSLGRDELRITRLMDEIASALPFPEEGDAD